MITKTELTSQVYKTMTIGRSSKKNKSPRSPPFLDKSNGFYGRLDEIGGDDVQVEGIITEDQKGTLNGGENQTGPDNTTVSGWMEEDDHVIDFNQGMMDDDGTTLLKRKPSRLSRRWSRKSSRKPKSSPGKETQKQSAETDNKEMPPAAQNLEATNSGEPEMVHFFIREHADDQILISRKSEQEKEMEDSRKEKKTEGKLNGDSTEIVKRNTLNNYCKAVDRAFRRGWETFITNLYSVTLTPISSTSSSSSPSVKSKQDRNRVLAEFI